MILIVGGMAAGKRTFAEKQLGADRTEMSSRMDGHMILYDLQNLDPLPKDEELLQKSIVICNEVGSGIVPMDPRDRAHREAVGRLCTRLAVQAERVYRVNCGLVMRLK